MIRNPSRRAVRAGFTLIELLVVIAIIAVLVGLTGAAVLRVLFKGPEIASQSDINQMSAAISTFKQEFGVKYMPSRIILHENMANYNPADPVEAESRAFLSMMFGRRLGATIDWNGNGIIDAGAAGRHDLRGEQCLVFFLGGAKTISPNSCQGFSASPSNPMAAGGTRRGPFFNFNSVRLVPLNGFFYYTDAFSKNRAYAYFSDYSTNQYRPGDTYIPGMGPYRVTGSDPLSAFLNQGGFQIISAGADGLFGNPASYATQTGTNDLNGRDDFANFSRGRLAAPQE